MRTFAVVPHLETHISIEEKQFRIMTESPVKPLILKLAAPTVVAMLITSVYNTADTYFVSRLGTSASGAVGVVFSLMAIVQAVGFTIGLGSGSIISRALGVRDHQKANRIASSALLLAVLLGVVLAFVGSFTIHPFMRLLGATETVLPYATTYASYILYAAPIMTGSFVLNNILRAEGKARYAMIGLATGSILNIALDPLFIFVFDMGIGGAAIATMISQVVSFVLLLTVYLRKKTVVELRPRFVSHSGRDYLLILRTGMPSFCRQGFASISSILLNTQAAQYGDAALSAMSIVTKVFMLIFCVGLGIGQGYQPVAGYNYASKKWRRLKEAYLFTYFTGMSMMLIFGFIDFVLAPWIMPLFISDPDVIAIGIKALRYQAVVMPLLTTNVMCNMTFQSIGRISKATLLSCCRQGFFFIPSVLLLPHLLGLTGVEMVQPVSDCFTFLVSLPVFLGFLREISKNVKNDENSE